MSRAADRFLSEHIDLSRRFFLKCGAGTVAALTASRADSNDQTLRDDRLQSAIDALESWLTPQSEFQDVSRGKPKPHSLPDETKKQVGLTRDTWKLDVVSDPDNPSLIRNPLSSENGNALDFAQLMQLAEQHAVRFPKVMTCLNIGCPLGMGIWEGVPLRHVLWMTQPMENLRRVFYHGYHNDDPKQMFRSSLPVGRILEDPFDLPPVILCYKLNGDWLTSERGGPVRVVVPEAYGFKSIKWLNRVVLSNLFHANDTYGEQNNDVDSPLKSFAATLSIPSRVAANEPFAVTGYAQSGISGLSKVQVAIQDSAQQAADNEQRFTDDPWQDAEILAPPAVWGGELPDGRIPEGTMGFDDVTQQPSTWPLRLGKAHWAVLLPGRPPGEYVFRCRTVDENETAQPLPRPFRKSGHAAIETKRITVE